MSFLIFIESQMIFISGPVVVAPLETITFHAFSHSQKISNIKWWKIKDQSKEEVKTGSEKYLSTSKGDEISILEIVNTEKKDSGAYQCTADSMESNTINVHVDGKYIYDMLNIYNLKNFLKCVISAKWFSFCCISNVCLIVFDLLVCLVLSLYIHSRYFRIFLYLNSIKYRYPIFIFSLK